MEKIEFRNLRAEEIECRVGSCTNTGASLLLYKDARCDMSMLDEKFGPMGWKRDHQLINGNLFCTVSVRTNNGEWVSKQDVGVESNTEKEKGQASDAFKRACVNWGIGRELYTAPFIWINLGDREWKTTRSGSRVPAVDFEVSAIEYKDKTITYLQIVDKKSKAVRYEYKEGKSVKVAEPVKATTATKKAEAPMSQEMEDALQDAMESIRQAKSRKELAGIYNELKAFQNNQRFVDALAERQKELKAEGITA